MKNASVVYSYQSSIRVDFPSIPQEQHNNNKPQLTSSNFSIPVICPSASTRAATPAGPMKLAYCTHATRMCTENQQNENDGDDGDDGDVL
jgi:hypothetical protein